MTLPGVSELSGRRFLGDLTEGFNPTIMNQLTPSGFVSQNADAALDVDVWPVIWNNAGTLDTYAGEEGFTLTANQTNYLYLDGAEAVGDQLKASTSAFPGPASGQFFYLAIVVTNSSAITSITQIREHSAVGAQANVQSVGVTAPITNTGTSTDPVIDIADATPGSAGVMPAANTDQGLWRQASGAFSLLGPGAEGTALKIISSALAWVKTPDLRAIFVGRAAASVSSGSDITLTQLFALGDTAEFTLNPDADNAAEIEVVNARKCLLVSVLAGGGSQSAVAVNVDGSAAESIGVMADTNAHATAMTPIEPGAGEYVKLSVTSGGTGSSTSQFVILLIFAS